MPSPDVAELGGDGDGDGSGRCAGRRGGGLALLVLQVGEQGGDGVEVRPSMVSDLVVRA